MNPHGDSGLTSAVCSGGLSRSQLEPREVGVSLGTGEQVGYGAAGFVDVAVSAQSMIAVPTVLVLQSVQFMTATGLRKCAKWDSALNASASRDHFAVTLRWTGAVLVACSSISLSPIWASYFLSGRGQT